MRKGGLILFAMTAMVAPAAAQPAPEPSGAIVVYDRAYFAQFNVTTAEDLLRRIPGVQDLLEEPDDGPGSGQQERGFGSTGSPILFNGRRLSGKNNDPLDALERIQARQVVRVEIITGSVPGLDIRIGSRGAVANIVLEDTLATGYGAWEASVDYHTTGLWRPGGKLNYSGNLGALGYIVSAEAGPDYGRRFTNDRFLLYTQDPFARLRLTSTSRGMTYAATAALTYGFANGDVANLNGRFERGSDTTKQPTYNYTILSPTSEVFTGSTLLIEDESGEQEWEIGGDYEHEFPGGDSVRALFVVNGEKQPSLTDFFSTPAGQTQVQTLRRVSRSQSSERIFRGYYNWNVADGHALEVGGEVAFNALDEENERYNNVGGALVRVPLFNSASEIRETRLESFSRYSWQISPTLYVEAAVDTEYSKLKQRGADVSANRSFFFAKPRFDVRYDVSPNMQLRGRVVRTVSQLDFSDFVSSLTISDTRIGVVQAGNPNLVPEKIWTYEATAQYRLPSDQGLVSLRGFYNDISDAIDNILIAPNEAGVGNIGSAHSYGVEMKVGVRLGWLGLPSASIEASGKLQNSSARDAFTGVTRPLQGFQDYTWTLGFRHDTKWHDMAYGVTFEGSDRRYGSDIDFTEWFKFRPSAEAFVEMRAAGLTFRLEGRQLFRTVTRDRVVYTGNRATSPLRRRELRYDTFDTAFSFIVKGTF